MEEMHLQNQSVKNILLLGRTGSGKSTLVNVLINKNNNFEEVFKESAGSVSETKQVQIQEFTVNITRDGKEKIRYLIIDTAGFGDTQLTEKEVLKLLQELALIVGDEGINRIFFVTNSRFTAEEIEIYKLLESVLFDKEANKYTTIIRTKFPEFMNEEKCEEDRRRLKEESKELFDILGSVKIVYIDNPPLVGRYAEISKETREESRQQLLTYLSTCQEIYKPTNLDALKQRVDEFMTKTEKLKKEAQEKEKAIEEERNKLQKEIDELRARQQSELEANRRNFDQQIQNAQNGYNQQLQNTRNQLQSNYQDQIQQSQESYTREQVITELRRRREIDDIRREYQNRTTNVGELYCSRGHSRNDGYMKTYGKYGDFDYDDFNDRITSIYCSTCDRYYGETRSYNWEIRNTTAYTFGEWCRERNQSHSQEIARMNREIEEYERRNRENISRLQQERQNRNIAFQRELDQQSQSQEQWINQQRVNNEANLNQQRQDRESQINSDINSQETNLRNQSQQQIQNWQAQIQQAEQGRNFTFGELSQYILGIWKK